MEKILVVYYSYSGNTKALANKIAHITGADIVELLPEKTYSFHYNTASKEVRNEIERGYCPQLISETREIDAYDIIFIGSPNWFKSIAPPVLSFLRSYDFAGKTVVPFCTHGGGEFGNIEIRIAEECANSVLLPGFSAFGDIENIDLTNWLNSINIY